MDIGQLAARFRNGCLKGAKKKLSVISLQSVADSVPAREYDECQNKARPVLRAFELAEKGL